MDWDWNKIKKSATKTLSDIGGQIDSAIISTTDYVQKELVPEVTRFGADVADKAKELTDDVRERVEDMSQTASKRISDWSREGKADHIPEKYTEIVKTALIAAAAAGPLGVTGGLADTIAVAGIWTTMFVAIRAKSNRQFGKDPKRIAGGVASGIVKYYIGCKLATYSCFLIPGAGFLAGMGVSAVCNIYFTYNFASIIIELMDTKASYSDDDIVNEIISLIKKLPSLEEIKEIVYIYKS